MGYCLVPFGSFQESYWHYTMGDNLACHVCRDLQFKHSEALHWLLFLFFPSLSSYLVFSSANLLVCFEQFRKSYTA